ncbi:MAG: single-stranded-DNA-specific exonuclease RecJ [Burkholderiaceae bacterium]|nr:single-stranded-DNA-specific exonuclease RecJ [Burkholderiaceae bacterium]
MSALPPLPTLAERPYDPGVAGRLTAAGIPAPLARALAARGILSTSELNPTLAELHAPALLDQCQRAAFLLAEAIEQGQRLLIVADYDCDGATACAVGVRALRAMGAQVEYLVPNRFEFGYGLTPALVELAAARHPDWIITVDNGVASVEGVERANALGIQVLITDHHLPGERLPAARAIVNPNVPGCTFPSKHLAGVGVMFYVLTALRAELRGRGRYDGASQPHLGSLLDLVALGTVADLVRLDRNNRALVSAGLQNIRRGSLQPGVAALFRAAGRSAPEARAEDLGFSIAPRINAAGRLAEMTVGIECLTCDDPARADELARQLDRLNRERRQIEAKMQEEAIDGIDAQGFAQRRSIVLFDPQWHQGIVGLVASRIKERYHRPTIAFAQGGDGTLRGSGRSIDGIHLRDTLDRVTKAAPALIERFGGHAMAAGLTLRREHLEAFSEAFEAATRAMADSSLFARSLATDGVLAPNEIGPELAEAIEAIVWGQGFAEPLFANEFEVLEQRLLQDRHLQLTLGLERRRLPAVWFGRTETLPSRARLAYRLKFDTYQGLRRIRLHVVAADRGN